MSEVLTKIKEVLAEQPLAVLSTITEDGKPWARYVALRADDDLTIKFSTFKGSRKVAQIGKNPEIHMVCGAASLQTARHYLQIQGRAEVSEDPAVRKAYWSDELKAYFQGPDDPNFVVVIVKPYRIEYNTMETMQAQVWEG